MNQIVPIILQRAGRVNAPRLSETGIIFLVLLKADGTFLPHYSLPPPCFLQSNLKFAHSVYTRCASQKKQCCQRLALFVPHLVTQDWPLGLRGSRCTKFGSNLVSYHECNTLHIAIRAHWH